MRGPRAARVLLGVVAFLTLMAAVEVWRLDGGAAGFGAALVLAVPAAAALLAARSLAAPRARTWWLVVALQAGYVLWQLARVADGDPWGLVGLALPLAIIVLAVGRLRPAARPAPDRGEGAVGYAALLLLVAAVVAALLSTGLPGQVSDHMRAAVCRVTVDEDCGDERPAPARPLAEPAEARPAPDDGNCVDWLDWACGLTDGVRRGVVSAVTDVKDGVVFAVCLVPVCDSSGDNWKGLEQLVTNPADSGKAMWDDATQPIRDDWNNGHKMRAVGFAVPSVLGRIFGSKGLGTLGKLPNKPKVPEFDRTSFAAFTDNITRRVHQGDDATLRGDIPAAEEHLRAAEKDLETAREAAKKGDLQEESHRVELAEWFVHRLKSDILLRKALLDTPGGKEATDLLIKHRISLEATHLRDNAVTYQGPYNGLNHPYLRIDNHHGHQGPLTEARARQLAPEIVRVLKDLDERRKLPGQD
ncbi:hypothetical protein [Actinomadura kijaniata]|uniref:hypothetical protein n=1 Tax=Actinomadura kijaniata TaxID=46161 RepID=UPI00083002E0|nr:hypothetical protein [Actinomadura kijaniata]